MNSLPDVQLALRPGIVEFGWGHPDQTLLPAAHLAEAARLALNEAGPAALSYGAEQGPACLLEQVAAWLCRSEGGAPPLDRLLITGGVSQALDLLCTLLTQPGDTVLVQAPVYHLALRIFRDHRLNLLPVAGDAEGLRPDALAEALAAARQAGRPATCLYTVTAFNNPSGATLSPARYATILELVEQAGLLVFEDDVYRPLWYDESPPGALYTSAPAGIVIRLGSFSKVLAPGLRLGWLAAAPEVIRRCTGSGLLDSGGGVNHFTAHVVATYMAQGRLDEHIVALRAAYRARRDALVAALKQFLPGTCAWNRPGGGFFLWLRLPPQVNAAALLPIAEAAGVSYVPGTRFYVGGGGETYLRLAFTLLPVPEMQEGVRRLQEAIVRL